MLMYQEVTANYGYMEKYLATEAGIQMMLQVGQVRLIYIPNPIESISVREAYLCQNG